MFPRVAPHLSDPEHGYPQTWCVRVWAEGMFRLQGRGPARERLGFRMLMVRRPRAKKIRLRGMENKSPCTRSLTGQTFMLGIAKHTLRGIVG